MQPMSQQRRVHIRHRKGCRLFLALAGIIFGMAGLQAGEPQNYSVRSWHSENGLAHNSVAAICQTHDGYVWLGTYSGLVRFDGVRFVTFDTENTPALETVRITSLREDSQGVLWIGHESGELTRCQNNVFEAVKVPATWRDETVADIFPEPGGKLWLAGSEGTLMRLPDGFKITNAVAGVDRSVTQFEKDRDGRGWVLRNGDLGWFEQDKIVPWLPGGAATGFRVQAIAASRQGGIWIAYDSKIRRWDGANWTNPTDSFAWNADAEGYITSMMELRSGALAVSSAGNGLTIFQSQANPLVFNRANKLDADRVRSLCEDREGNLWVGVGNSGLAMLRPADFTTYLPPDQMNGCSALSVSPCREGGVWVGSEGAGLYRFDGQVWSNYLETQGVLSRYIWSVSQATDGKVWAGSWGKGLFVGQAGSFQTAPGLQENKVPMPALLVVTNDELWIGTRVGLLHYRQGATTWYGPKEGLVSPDVRCVAQGPEGAIWFGMMGGGLGCLQDDQIRQIRKPEGLPSDSILCLHSETNGVLWLGTFGGGVIRFKDGKFSQVTTHDGLANNFVSHIEDDGLGHFWFASEGGVFFASKAALNRFADLQTNNLHCTTFDINDGMEVLGCTGGFQPSGCRTADGRLWFPTLKGIVSVNPARLHTNPLPPPVLIEGLFTNDLETSNLIPSASRVAKIPVKLLSGYQRFEIRYTALSFTDPEKVRFKYRLEGLENEWKDAGQKRTAIYGELPPGKYNFRVQACNNDEVWNETGATQAIIILPHFWQRTSFQAATYLLAAAIVGAWVRYFTRRRYRRKLAAVERERALERERSRIARDIHDDLGASLTRITMLSGSARRESAPPEETAGCLQIIYQTSCELTRLMDEIVWAVNPRHDTLKSLATYLVRFAQEFLEPAGIRLRSEIPLELPPLPISSEVRHNVFLAYKEALHNVVKHGRASAVHISLTLEETFIEIVVMDNGIGFAPRSGSADPFERKHRLAGGNGLKNMKNRLEQIHGECRIESGNGQGITVVFRIPLRDQSA
jgi:signal transduction histidine kinase/ligand-binding sensor domain-containing protein